MTTQSELTNKYYKTLVAGTVWKLLSFRKEVIRECAESAVMRSTVWEMCRRDILFYINVFGWLQEPRSASGKREIPFATCLNRKYQCEYILRMQRVVEKCGRDAERKDIGLDKSREVGATWMVLYLADWYYRFYPQSHIGLTSRNMDAVDNPEDPDSLMSKLDFIQSKLPDWFARHHERRRVIDKHSIRNTVNGSTIIGYPSTEAAGRGGRKLFFVMDELHFFPAGDDYAVMASTQHATYCRIVVSTPNKRRGESGAYYDFITDENANLERIVIDWKDDTSKRSGLYTSSKENGLEILDSEYEFPDDYPFILDGKVRSPYYDSEWNRPLATPQSIACELDRNFAGATYRFMPEGTLERAAATVMVPYTQGWLSVDPSDCDLTFNEVPNGPFLSWVQFAGNRPPPDTYCVGFDIATGTGGEMSSNSAFVVFSLRTGEQVAEFADNTIDPTDFAVVAVGVCKWFYDAKMIPEINGVGGIFMKRVLSLRYANIYRRKMKDVPFRKVQDKIGYTNQDAGLELLGGLKVGIDTGRCTIRSKWLVKELGQYIYIDGNLKHSGERGTEVESAKGKSHGDRAIAAGCAWHGVTDVMVPKEEIEESQVPVGCFLDRQNKARERDRFANSGLWCP